MLSRANVTLTTVNMKSQSIVFGFGIMRQWFASDNMLRTVDFLIGTLAHITCHMESQVLPDRDTPTVWRVTHQLMCLKCFNWLIYCLITVASECCGTYLQLYCIGMLRLATTKVPFTLASKSNSTVCRLFVDFLTTFCLVQLRRQKSNSTKSNFWTKCGWDQTIKLPCTAVSPHSSK